MRYSGLIIGIIIVCSLASCAGCGDGGSGINKNNENAPQSTSLTPLEIKGAPGTSPAVTATNATGTGESLFLPAGTPVKAKVTLYTLSDDGKTGNFSALLAAPLKVDGKVVAPAGAQANGVLKRGSAGAVLSLDFISVGAASYTVLPVSDNTSREVEANGVSEDLLFGHHFVVLLDKADAGKIRDDNPNPGRVLSFQSPDSAKSAAMRSAWNKGILQDALDDSGQSSSEKSNRSTPTIKKGP